MRQRDLRRLINRKFPIQNTRFPYYITCIIAADHASSPACFGEALRCNLSDTWKIAALEMIFDVT